MRRSGNGYIAAAIMVQLVLAGALLLALFTRTEPHLPLEVDPFALGPFLAASLATGAAAYCLMIRGRRFATPITLLFALTALVFHGPQKYADPEFPRIGLAMIVVQLAIGVILGRAVLQAVRTVRSNAEALA